MLLSKINRISLITFAFVFFLSCASYETRIVPFKMPSAYPNATEVAGAMIAAQAYDDKKEAKTAFGFDIIGAGILTIRGNRHWTLWRLKHSLQMLITTCGRSSNRNWLTIGYKRKRNSERSPRKRVNMGDSEVLPAASLVRQSALYRGKVWAMQR